MAKIGEIVTLTLTHDQSKQFAAVLGAPDTTLVNMPANRVEVESYEGTGDASIMLHLRVTRLSLKRTSHKARPRKTKTRARAR